MASSVSLMELTVVVRKPWSLNFFYNSTMRRRM